MLKRESPYSTITPPRPQPYRRYSFLPQDSSSLLVSNYPPDLSPPSLLRGIRIFKLVGFFVLVSGPHYLVSFSSRNIRKWIPRTKSMPLSPRLPTLTLNPRKHPPVAPRNRQHAFPKRTNHPRDCHRTRPTMETRSFCPMASSSPHCDAPVARREASTRLS